MQHHGNDALGVVVREGLQVQVFDVHGVHLSEGRGCGGAKLFIKNVQGSGPLLEAL